MDVYRERAYLLGFLAKQYESYISYNDPNEPNWAVLYVYVKGRQMTWHISPTDMDLFDHVGIVPNTHSRVQFDDHTTDEKYTRLYNMK